MISRRIANTEITCSAIGFGTGSLHHHLWYKDRCRLLECAFDHGISHFDTSPYYGFGLAEKDIGRCFKEKREKITLATKVGLYSPEFYPNAIAIRARKVMGRWLPRFSDPIENWDVSRANQSLELSLKRLQTSYIDFLFLHEPDFAAINHEAFLNWLDKVKQAGKIRYWGVAGIETRLHPFVKADSLLAKIVQTKDSLEDNEAQFVLKAERLMQFTYGYLNGSAAGKSVSEVMSQALRQNSTGTILISTRRVERIREIVASFI